MEIDGDILHLSYDRNPTEYVDAAFAASGAINKPPHKKTQNFIFRVGVWVALFLAALIFFRLLDMGDVDPNLSGGFALGLVVGLLGAALFGFLNMRKMHSRYVANVPLNDTVYVTVAPESITSKSTIFEVKTNWAKTGEIWIERECLYVMVELFVIMVPARALEGKMTLQELHNQILAFQATNETGDL